MPVRHGVLREGALVGILGAAGVALWFLFIDWLAGRPLFTPSALGAALFGTGTIEEGVVIDLWAVLGYTLFHDLVFILVGVVTVACVHLAEREPAFMALFLVLFVMFEMGFYGLVAVLDQLAILETLAWYQIGAGNLVATLVMGGTVLYRHPKLTAELQDALESRPV